MNIALLKQISVFIAGFIIGFITYLLSDYAGCIYELPIRQKSSLKRLQKIGDDWSKDLKSYKTWSQSQNTRISKLDLDAFIYGIKNSENKITLESDWLKSQVPVTCVVFVEKLKLAATIKDTWGNRCNRLLFFSQHLADLNLSVINLGIKFTSSWQLLCEAMNYIWKRRDEIPVQWLIFVKDDTIVIPENLRYILAPLDYRQPYYLGHPVVLWGQVYNVAQAGYVLSYEVLQRLMKMFNSSEKCANGGKYWKKEDYYLGKHLTTLQISPSDTRDAEKRGTFHEFPLNFLLHGSAKSGSYYSRALYPPGPECCSNRTVTFNIGESDKMRTIDYMLYQLNTFEHGIYGNQPAPTPVTEDEVWRSALRDEFNLTDIEDISSERYFQIWRSKYSEPEMFIAKHFKIKESVDALN